MGVLTRDRNKNRWPLSDQSLITRQGYDMNDTDTFQVTSKADNQKI